VYYLALVPHRDCLKKIRAEKERRFFLGDFLALSFPDVYPLMTLDAPLDRETLKKFAQDLRRASFEGTDVKGGVGGVSDGRGGGTVLCGSKHAALANMTLEVIKGGGFGLEWQIGPPVWLPNPRAKVKHPPDAPHGS
jgi:hypothetical protein